jgi:REP element-mobilizing transposase RayT
VPRAPRDDQPGAVHHLILRGVEKRVIVLDDEDRYRFLARLAEAVALGEGRCFAWALMPNHFHLLHETGPWPVARVMHWLGSCYAMDFNRKYDRVGHLFQGRYRAVPVGDGASLLNVLRYVHLNPVKAGLVADLERLGTYPWSGHAALLGNREAPFLSSRDVLGMFSADPAEARRKLLAWMSHGYEESGPGILGSRGEVDARWGTGRARDDDAALHRGLADFLRRVCDAEGVEVDDVIGGRRTRAISRARALAAYLAWMDLGVPPGKLARALGVTGGAAARCIRRGRSDTNCAPGFSTEK